MKFLDLSALIEEQIKEKLVDIYLIVRTNGPKILNVRPWYDFQYFPKITSKDFLKGIMTNNPVTITKKGTVTIAVGKDFGKTYYFSEDAYEVFHVAYDECPYPDDLKRQLIERTRNDWKEGYNKFYKLHQKNSLNDHGLIDTENTDIL